MWSKILIPVDGSDLSDRILEVVARILERRAVLSDESLEPGAVRLLRVVTEAELHRGEELARDELAVARERLEVSVQRLGEHAARATAEVVVGDPAAAILEAAARWEPTVIAMTTHGRTGFERLVRGSVAERILRSSPSPVLLANPFAAGRDATLPFQKILVPLDGSDRGAEILPRVKAIARFFDAEVVLVHVVPVWLVEDEDGAGRRAREAAGADALARAVARLQGVRVRARLAFGGPAAAILEIAAEEKADLLALTTHGRTGPARWALGSVAEDVLRHCRGPVLLQRSLGVAAAL